MIGRRVYLALLLSPAYLALGCYGPSESPTTAESPAEQKEVAQLPQAPPPHPKKTTAELLVGKWRMIKDGGKPLPPRSSVHMEFMPDGRFKVAAEDAVRKFIDTGTGNYKLNDRMITLKAEASELHPARAWDVKIELLTDTELIGSTGNTVAQRSEFVRVSGK